MDQIIQEDTFEDAHDKAPETPTIRSLTEKPLSNPRQSVPESETDSSTKEDPPAVEEHKEPTVVDPEPQSENETEDKFEEVGNEPTSLEDDDELTLGQQSRPSVSPTQRISVSSQLDNVSLDDETSAEPKGLLIQSINTGWHHVD